MKEESGEEPIDVNFYEPTQVPTVVTQTAKIMGRVQQGEKGLSTLRSVSASLKAHTDWPPEALIQLIVRIFNVVSSVEPPYVLTSCF